MKKKAIIIISLTPFIYLYSLAENHFSFGMTFKGFTYEFINEYFQAWRVLFGAEYKDNSMKIAIYEFKQKSKKAKFDIDVAFCVKKEFGGLFLRFPRKRELKYHFNSDYGDKYLHIVQHGKDEFRLGYYNSNDYGYKRSLTTDYTFTKEEVIGTITAIKNSNY